MVRNGKSIVKSAQEIQTHPLVFSKYFFSQKTMQAPQYGILKLNEHPFSPKKVICNSQSHFWFTCHIVNQLPIIICPFSGDIFVVKSLLQPPMHFYLGLDLKCLRKFINKILLPFNWCTRYIIRFTSYFIAVDQVHFLNKTSLS